MAATAPGPRFTGCSAALPGHPDYPCSAALQHSDLIWTEETVARPFEVGPDVMVPGSKMPLLRIQNAADRAAPGDLPEAHHDAGR
jgi:cytochrome c2